MDVFTKEKRSAIMAAVRGKNTTPELLVRRALHKRGLRFRLHKKGLPGNPDIVFPSAQVAVLIHGCFWHRHRCRRGTVPTSNIRFWRTKLDANRARDVKNRRRLRQLGWRVVVIWECETKIPERLAEACGRVEFAVQKPNRP